MPTELSRTALQRAIVQRRPLPVLTVHSDRGSQYASHQQLLTQYGLTASMRRKGNCWDTQFTMSPERRPDLTRAGIGGTALALPVDRINAVMERFFLNLKMERL